MRKLKISLNVVWGEKKAVRLLQWLANENAALMAAHPDWPLLYDSGVFYRREKGRELWLDVAGILEQGHDDCDGLAAARAGELMARGWKAMRPGDEGWDYANRHRPEHIQSEIYLRTRTTPDKPGLYHVVPRYKLGDTWFKDDPSARLGMYGGRVPEAQCRRWKAAGRKSCRVQ